MSRLSCSLIPLVLLTLSAGGCATPNVMLNHTPELLMELPQTPIPPTGDFQGQPIVVDLVADMTTAPTGAHFDDHFTQITSVVQTYLVARPGHVLHGKIVEWLGEQNAEAYRRYGTGPDAPAGSADAIRVGLTLTDFELHCWKTREDQYWVLVRARMQSAITGGGQDKQDEVTLEVKVPADTDVFDVMAMKYCAYLARQIGKGV